MPRTYTEILQEIASIPAREIKNARINLFHELVQHIGTRYKILKENKDGPIAKGGQALLVKATALNGDPVAIKFALPDLLKKSSIWQQLKMMDKASRRLKKIGWADPKFDTEDSVRFMRGISIQKQLYKHMMDKGLSEYGYIPKILEFSPAPKLFLVMEYMPYEPLLDHCEGKPDAEKLAIFGKMVKFIELVVHANSIVHSDLKPDNWLVSGQLPCLLDFGLAVNPHNQENKITGKETEGQGSYLYASTKQLVSFVDRSFDDDIYTLCLVFWAIMVGREPMIAGSRNLGGADEMSIHDVFLPDELKPEYRTLFRKGTGGVDAAHCYLCAKELREDVELLIENTRKTEIRKTEIHVHKKKLAIDWAELARLCDAHDKKHPGRGKFIYQFFLLLDKIE